MEFVLSPAILRLKTLIINVRLPQNLANFYIGSSAFRLPKRISIHYSTFRYVDKRNTTGFSKLIWSLKDLKKNYFWEWKIISTSFPQMSRPCNSEQFFILFTKNNLLNTFKESVYRCLHWEKKHNFGLFNRCLTVDRVSVLICQHLPSLFSYILIYPLQLSSHAFHSFTFFILTITSNSISVFKTICQRSPYRVIYLYFLTCVAVTFGCTLLLICSVHFVP